MAIVLEITNLSVLSDDSEKLPATVEQVTELEGGTVTTPSSGAGLREPLRVVLGRGSSPVETLFDATKLYKVTIEEL